MLNSRCLRNAGRHILRSIALLLICLGANQSLMAQEPVQQFLEGLRQRGYFDTAIEYIDQQQANSSLPDTLKESLGFEKAMTFLGMSRQARTSGAKAKSLTQAQAELEKFAQQFPGNSLAAKANSELGNILFERARTAVWQASTPPAGKTKAGLLGEARSLIQQARQIYRKANDLSKNRLSGMRPPAVSDGDREEERIYREVQGSFLSSALQLARCTYEEGQTYERGSKQRKEKLIAASEEFRDVHEKYRTWISGLLARIWQAKCFEELDEVATALGIYNEVLAKQKEDPTARRLHAKAQRFKFICLNHPKKRDHEIVIRDSDAWLSARTNNPRSEDGIGIRWQKARAHDLLAQGKADEESSERNRQLRLALTEATAVSRFDTAYKDVAQAMVRRLKVELGDRQGPPKSFGEAFDLARTDAKKLSAFKAAARSAKSKQDRQKARENLQLTLLSADEMLNLALQLADDKVEPSQKFQAQYLLAFVKYEQRNSLDAIVLSRHVMRYAAKAEPQTAMNAGDVAISSCVQAFNDAGDNNEFEMRLLESVSNEIITEWPDSNRANEARMSLGMINHRSNRPEEASKWYSQVPRSAPQFGEAQLAAGQSWWKASLSAGNSDASVGELDPNRIVEMTNNAETFLRSGLKAMFNPASTPPGSVTAGKLSLAQILNSRGEFTESIKLLSDGNQSVMKAIEVSDQSARPAEGVKSKDFASLAYQVLLRAFVGTQQIDQALSAMTEMEKIGGPDTQIYVQLGQELEREIDRLKVQNDTERLNQLRSSFEEFLSKVFERKDRQNYNSLIWVGETYRGLGQGMNDDPAAAKQYFQRASESYQRILDQNLVDERRKTTVELRLVACKRSVKDFDGAMKKLREIIAQHPTDMTAQFEACQLLSEWGKNGQPQKLNEAMSGTEDKKIWGWFGLSTRLEANPNYRERFFEARFGRVESQRDFAMVGEPGKKKDRLENAKRDIELLVSTQGAFNEPWWGRFDSYYKKLQRDLGVSKPVPLEKPEEFVAAPVERKKDVSESVKEPVVSAASNTVEKPPESNSLLGLAIALPIALLAAAGMWFVMAKPRKKSATVSISQGPAPSFDGIGVAAPVKQKLPSGTVPRKKSAAPTRKKAATKRQLTPEEAAKRKALIARKRAAQAAQDGGAPVKKKKKITVKKKATDAAGRPATAKKKPVQKPPRKPPEAS
ncbi:MAG: hypothetical protein AB8G99_07940 [Planctomycetaceae bacterium]